MIFDLGDQFQRLKWAFSSCKNGAWGTEPNGDGDVICIRAADFDGQLGRLKNSERTLRSIDSETFEKVSLSYGDIIIEKSGGGEKQLVGRAAIFDGDEPSFTSNFLARCRPAQGVDPRYLNYLLLAIYNGRGTYPHLKQSTGIQNLDLGSFLDIKVNILPLKTQCRIAKFLDEKTARIDGLIEKKRALLNRLAEKRQALITCAVSKGLNPDAPMKPSGVDWLGDIPAHWDCKRLRFAMLTNPSKREIKLEDDEFVSFVPMEAVGEYGGLDLETEKELADVVDGYTYFADNDVVIAKITPCFENGKGALASGLKNGVAFGTTELHVMRGHENLLSEYLFYISMSYPFAKIGESEMYGSGGQKRLPERYLKNFRIGLPSTDEQIEIIEYINRVNGNSDLQAEKALESVNKLSEYRAAIITSAITGRIEELLHES